MSISRLISLGTIISQSKQSFANNELEILPLELCRFLFQANGLFAFESALMIRPLVRENEIYSVFEWNDYQLWKFSYANDQILNTIFFAEDVFGCQFGFFEDCIWFFNPETSEFDLICNTFCEWCELILSDYNQYTGYEIIHKWQSKNGPISPGFRLCPKLPFVLGGQYETDNLYATSALDGMLLRADIANQIRNLPDGIQTRIVIE